MIKIIINTLIFIFICANNCLSVESVTKGSITWTFSSDTTCGTFATGDPWCVYPFTIVSISPEMFIDSNGYKRHGTMINPSPSHGYTTGYGEGITYNTYIPDLNIEESLPYTVSSAVSVVSAKVYTVDDPRPGNSCIKEIQVLTALQSAPPAGSFRPPYSGTDKSILYNESSIDYTKLANLAHTPSTPSFSTVTAKYWHSPWIDHTPNHVAQRTHPVSNMPEYGANIHDVLNVSMTLANMNGTDADKRNLVVGLIQAGIDFYRLSQLNRTQWVADGGHAGGRKLPIIFAGVLLNDDGMKSVGAKSGDYLYDNGYGPGNVPPDYLHFGEDDQTHYITSLDVSITNSLNAIPWTPSGIALTSSTWNTYSYGDSYSASDLGIPEYGIRHAKSPGWNTKGSDVYKSYRGLPDRAFPGTAMVIHIMGLKTLWNHQALLDYADRLGNSYGWYLGTFMSEVWQAYRSNYPPVWAGGVVDIINRSMRTVTGTAVQSPGSGRFVQ